MHKPCKTAEPGKGDTEIKYSNGRDYHDGFMTSDHRDATKGMANPNIDENRDWSRSDASKTGLVDRELL